MQTSSPPPSQTRWSGVEVRPHLHHYHEAITVWDGPGTVASQVPWKAEDGRRFPPADFLAYAHSDYAGRWGAEPASITPRSHLWALTVGRMKLSLGRRRRAARAARLVAGDSGQRRLRPGHQEQPEAARRASPSR
jgi:hypothetical protein